MLSAQVTTNNRPPPSADESAHSQKVLQLICDEIDKYDGRLCFARYMELALYAPGLGYYSAGKTKFGKAGDFVTAPEISPLFSFCLAKQSAQVLDRLEGGNILELGAGSGIMAAQLLLELERLNSLPTHYFILEISADLKQQQQTTLKHHCPHLLNTVRWLDGLPEAPFNGVILANEVLDAMPVHLFELSNNNLFEKVVCLTNNQLDWGQDKPSVDALSQAYVLQQRYALGDYQSELNLAIQPWLNSLTACLDKGFIFLIDYGFSEQEYYHPQRHMGTLMCHYRHHAHPNPLVLPGLQDITAHVDFTAVARAALSAGLTPTAFSTQAAFLLSTGLLSHLEKANDVADQFELSQQVKRLTLPTEMGELFKVIALGKDISMPLLGFSIQNQIEKLGV